MTRNMLAALWHRAPRNTDDAQLREAMIREMQRRLLAEAVSR